MSAPQKPRFVEAKQLVPRSTDGIAPPYAARAEESCISAVLEQERFLDKILLLRPEHFYVEANRVIWQTMLELRSRGTPIDFVNLAEELKGRGRMGQVGGLEYVAKIIDACPAVTHVESHAQLVIDKAKKRTLIAAAQMIEANTRLDGDEFEKVAAAAQAMIDGVAASMTGLRVESGLSFEIPEPEEPFLVPSLKIGPGRATLFAGDAYTGKTLALQELVLAIATGRFLAWGVHRVPEPGRVLWMNLEARAKTWKRRMVRIMRSRGVTGAELEGKLDVAHHPTLRLDDDGAEAAFTAAVRGYKVCVIDSLIACLEVTQEKDEQIGRIILRLLRVSERTGCTFILIHHTTKPPQMIRRNASGEDLRDAKDSIRGSRSILGACDGVFVLVSGGKNKPIRIVHEKSPTDGHTIDDQYLRFCDEERVDMVSGDVDTKFGLYCDNIPVEQMQQMRKAEAKKRERSDGSAAFDQFCERILELVKAHPGSSGAQIKERMGKVSKDRVYAGLQALASRTPPVIKAEPGPKRAELWRAV